MAGLSFHLPEEVDQRRADETQVEARMAKIHAKIAKIKGKKQDGQDEQEEDEGQRGSEKNECENEKTDDAEKGDEERGDEDVIVICAQAFLDLLDLALKLRPLDLVRFCCNHDGLVAHIADPVKHLPVIGIGLVADIHQEEDSRQPVGCEQVILDHSAPGLLLPGRGPGEPVAG